MSETSPELSSAQTEIGKLQAAIDQTNIRRAAELTMAEKFRLGAELYDEGMRWLTLIIKAERPDFTEEQVDQELERRRAIKRRVEEVGRFRTYIEDDADGEV